MNNFLISTVIAVNIFLAPIVPNAIPMGVEKSEIKTEKKEFTEWAVKPAETLSAIAINYYGNENYWTTIWNDNSWIKNPYSIEVNWKLKLRTRKPGEPERLKPELEKKIQPSILLAKADNDTQKVQSQPAAYSYTGRPLNDAQIQFLGNCESGMTATRNSGNGYYGAFQFSIGTWNSMGTGYARADMAPLEVQIDAVQRLVARSNIFGQFPACSRRMHAAGLI